MNPETFVPLAANVNKYGIQIGDYVISGGQQEHDRWLRYDTVKQEVGEPKISVWEYMSEGDLKKLLEMKGSTQMRKFIDSYFARGHPKGFPRIIFQELIYNATKFCKSAKLTLEQTAVVLSQFYLTHRFFTSNLDMGAQKVYNYFKELQMCHSLPFPPNKTKLFNLEECKKVLLFFCKIYLRNLPLIRLLSLPNFAMSASYHLEPEINLKKRKSKKDKKTKKKKK